MTRRAKLQRTPKVFGSSYRPTKTDGKTTSQSSVFISRLKIKFLLWPFLLVLAILGVTRLPVFQIQHVNVDGVDNPQLQADFRGLIGQSIFSRRIAQTIEAWVLDDASLVTINCRKGLPNSLSCQATTREPALIWMVAGKEYLVDQNGTLYAEKGPQSLTTAIVEDRITTAPKIGSLIASAEVIEQITRLQQLLATRSITTSRFFIADSLYQIGAVVTQFKSHDQIVQKELTALFISTQPLEAQTRSLETLLNTQGEKVTTHIDLRVPGYVYYK